MTKIRKMMQKTFTNSREQLWQVLSKACMYKERNREVKEMVNNRLMKGMLSEVTDGGESCEKKCQKDNPKQLWVSQGRMDRPISHHCGDSK